jgi:hypothetical protein
VSAILIDVVKTLIGTLIIAFLGWIAGPLKWLVHNRELRLLVSNERRFLFVFDVDRNGAKDITFREDGSIGLGRNNQEFTWKIRRGAMEIFASDGKIYSRFRRDRKDGILYHTNDLDLRSKHGQYMKPRLIKVDGV